MIKILIVGLAMVVFVTILVLDERKKKKIYDEHLKQSEVKTEVKK